MNYIAKSTGQLTASALVNTGKGILTSVLVITDGSNPATVTIYDNTAGSGKMLAKFYVPGATGYGGRNWTVPVQYENGIYCTVSGTGASAIVEYI